MDGQLTLTVRRTVADTVRLIAHPVARLGTEIGWAGSDSVRECNALTSLFALVALNDTRPARFLNRASQVRVLPGALQQVLVEVCWTRPLPDGELRISLTYDVPNDAGKTDPQTDTFHGHFLRLVPDAEVVQVVEFETADPGLQGEMTTTYTLAEATNDGTGLDGVHEDLPAGVRPEDNELGWSMSIDKLARLVETAS